MILALIFPFVTVNGDYIQKLQIEGKSVLVYEWHLIIKDAEKTALKGAMHWRYEMEVAVVFSSFLCISEWNGEQVKM